MSQATLVIDEETSLLVPHNTDEPVSMKSILSECRILYSNGWPIVASFFISQSINIAPIFSLGHLGTNYLAAIALTTMYCNITGFAVGLGMASALDTLCSQSFTGSSDKYALGKHLQRDLLIQFILFLVVLPIWFNAEIILIWLGQDAEIAAISGVFARWLSIGLYPYLVAVSIIKYLQGQGIMKGGLIVMSIVSPINAFLQWALVWSEFAGVGAIGAPIATSVTNTLSCILTILYVIFINGHQCWGGWDLNEIFNWRQLRLFIKLGIPGIFMLCSEWWAFELMALAAGLLGTTKLASQTIMLQCCSIFFLFPLGFSVAGANRIGNLLGANQPLKGKSAAMAGLVIGGTLGLCNGLILYIFAKQITFMFTDDQLVLQYVMEIIVLVASYQFNDGLKACASGSLQGCGLQKIGAILNTVGYYVIAFPLSALLGFYYGYGLMGFWIGIISGLVLVSIAEAYMLIYTVDWKEQAIDATNRARADDYLEISS